MDILLSNKKLLSAVIVVIGIGFFFKAFLLGLIPVSWGYFYKQGDKHGYKKGYDFAKKEDEKLLDKAEKVLLKDNFINSNQASKV